MNAFSLIGVPRQARGGNNTNSKVGGLGKGKYSFAWEQWELDKGRQVPDIQQVYVWQASSSFHTITLNKYQNQKKLKTKQNYKPTKRKHECVCNSGGKISISY